MAKYTRYRPTDLVNVLKQEVEQYIVFSSYAEILEKLEVCKERDGPFFWALSPKRADPLWSPG